MSWPHQNDVDVFYGNPRGRNGQASSVWEAANLTYIKPPFAMKLAWEPGSALTKIKVHKKCADSLLRVLNKIWEASGKDQKKINEWGANLFGGSYSFRLMRGGSRLSMHSWGCAIDLDPARNGLGDSTPGIMPDSPIVAAFKSEGWTWGGDWNGNGKVSDERRPDAMHFQAANV